MCRPAANSSKRTPATPALTPEGSSEPLHKGPGTTLYKVSGQDRLRALLLALISFLLFAPPFSRQLNSDAAIHILMTLRWEGLESLYFWGQDRLGSLVPMAAMPLAKAGLHAVWAYALVLWGLLYLMWEALAGLLQSPLSRLLAAWVVWFPFPTASEFLMPGHPYAPQLAVLAWAWRWACGAITSEAPQTRIYLPLLSGLATGVALWISEFTIVFVVASVVMMVLIVRLFNLRGVKIFWLPWMAGFLAVLLVILKIKKRHPHPVPAYGQFLGSLEGFVEGVHTSLRFFIETFQHFGQNPFTVFSLLSLGVAALILVIGLGCRQLGRPFPLSGLFFLMNAGAAVPALWASAWVQLSGFEVRYFAYPVVFLLLALAAFGEALEVSVEKAVFYGFTVLGFALFGIRTVEREFVLSRLDERCFSIQALRGEPIPPRGGILGSYWNSYILALGRDPSQPVSAEEGTQRNETLAVAAVSQDSVWVCGTGWLDYYPNYLVQFNRVLERCDSVIRGTRVGFCLYRPAQHEEILSLLHPARTRPMPDSVKIAGGTVSDTLFVSGVMTPASPLYLAFFFEKLSPAEKTNIFMEPLGKDCTRVTLPFFRMAHCEGDTCVALFSVPCGQDGYKVWWENYSGKEVVFRLLRVGFVVL